MSIETWRAVHHPERPDYPGSAHWSVVNGAGKEIANTLYRDSAIGPDEDQKNARLLAAAPAMFGLCKRLAELTDGTFSEADVLDNLEKIGDLARSIVAAAEGQS
jgi:hypothetical protein